MAGCLLALALAAPGRPPPPRTAGPAPGGAAGLLFGRPLDPNRAAPAALEALPRIGPARAAAIAAAREGAPFCRLEDLLRVPGIGPHTLAAAAPGLALAPPPAACPPPRAGAGPAGGYREAGDPRGGRTRLRARGPQGGERSR